MYIDCFSVSRRRTTSIHECEYPHSHSERHQIIYSLTNIGSIVLGDYEFSFKPNYIYYAPNGVAHECKNKVGTDYHIYFFTTSDPAITKGLESLPYEIQPRNLAFTKYLIEQMQLQKCSKDALSDFYIFGYFSMFLITIMDITFNPSIPVNNITPSEMRYRPISNAILNESFDTLLVFINTYYMTDINIERMCEFSGYKKTQIYRLFKSNLGTTPHQYVNSLRIKLAKYLLKNISMHITDIASATGFQSHYAFSRVFKSIEGCTPSEYRKLILI